MKNISSFIYNSNIYHDATNKLDEIQIYLIRSSAIYSEILCLRFKCYKGLKGRCVVLYLCLGWSWRENFSCCSNENVKYNNSITFAQYLS